MRPPPQTIDVLSVADTIVPVADYEVESTDIKTAPGVSLTDVQRLLTGSVLDVNIGPSMSNVNKVDSDVSISYLPAGPQSKSYLFGKMTRNS